MENYSVYEDIASRTNGDIYIGVVGPVRTGKSTFIKRFMEKMVIPNAAEQDRAVMVDELPQSSSGKTVMTTEPKFVPAKAANVSVTKGAEASVRLVDCVGFAVEGAFGFEEDGEARLVKTPWLEQSVPFEQAAAIGTEKVIKEHSTIGVLVTTDGSVTGIPRENYLPAEERAAESLKQIGKPFVVLLNCKSPNAKENVKLAAELEKKYAVPVLSVNVEEMEERDIELILQKALLEFPVARIDVRVPDFLRALPEEHPVVSGLVETLKTASQSIVKMKDCFALETLFGEGDFLPTEGLEMQLGRGRVEITVKADEKLFYKIASEQCGEEVDSDLQILRLLKKLSEAGRQYEKIKDAFLSAEEKGYGVVKPCGEELRLQKPDLIRKNGGYGVRFKAGASSYHVIKVDVTGDVQPIIGTRKQSEDFIEEVTQQYDTQQEKVWETNIFGKSLKDLMTDELSKKTEGLPPEICKKLTRAIGRVVNDGKGGFLCILI